MQDYSIKQKEKQAMAMASSYYLVESTRLTGNFLKNSTFVKKAAVLDRLQRFCPFSRG